MGCPCRSSGDERGVRRAQPVATDRLRGGDPVRRKRITVAVGVPAQLDVSHVLASPRASPHGVMSAGWVRSKSPIMASFCVKASA